MKKVDDAYKKKVSEEKKKHEKQPQQDSENMGMPKGEFFSSLILSLSVEAMRSLGDVQDPDNPDAKSKLDKTKAEYFIELISVLEEKTKGNLTDQEQKFISATLYELRLNYARKIST